MNKKLLLEIFTSQSKLYVDSSIILNIILVLLFFVLLYFPSKLNKERIYLNREFTDLLRGVAMFLIVMHHLSMVIVDFTDMIFFYYFGFIGVGCYLFLSGYGLTESYKDKGISDSFIKSRFYRIFIPIFLINSIVFLINIFIARQNIILIKSIAGLFGIININWFIGFIVFWYLIYFFCFKSNIPDYSKILILFAVSFVILAADSVNQVARINALSFPCGVLISRYNRKIYEYFKDNKNRIVKMPIILYGIVSIITLFVIIGIIKNHPLLNDSYYSALPTFIKKKPLTIFELRLILIGVCLIVSLIFIIYRRKEITVRGIGNTVMMVFFIIISAPYIPREQLKFFIANSLVIILCGFLIYFIKAISRNHISAFFTMWGRMSLEILILHGFLMLPYAYIFNKLKLPIYYSVFILIIVITFISYLFFKLSMNIRKVVSN